MYIFSSIIVSINLLFSLSSFTLFILVKALITIRAAALTLISVFGHCYVPAACIVRGFDKDLLVFVCVCVCVFGPNCASSNLWREHLSLRDNISSELEMPSYNQHSISFLQSPSIIQYNTSLCGHDVMSMCMCK